MLLALAVTIAAMGAPDLPVAVPVAVCVVAPRVEALSLGDARGEVPLPRPQLVVIEPLQELRILRGNRLVWQRAARGGPLIVGPLRWPVAAIAPAERVLLLLRPRLAPEGAFAHVELVGARPDRMQAAELLVSGLGDRPGAWAGAIEAALVAGDVSLAWALLFHPAIPADPELAALRAEVIRRGCGD